ncbi:Dyp-type peroxidase [Methylobacterium haplocladii]|uniref:Peroxidase n=1 Tax=Methylobacterium haplocladii TaxID=1176176 RepID=A0A512INU5_9HYPH|nr:peroxidase [Methylobacterium haplocladii]GEO99365.1 peroxidase [Methylobacterium haplocladii]GJD83432.1 Multifunctional dye peroxidase DyP2 [Methylobacterium haplocladii]GLS60579.1 peroxidase [Methylobacterium haplocladii]
MPIDLDAPLSWKNADRDELLLLQCLQGNILKGHGRDFTANLFFRFDPARTRESRRLLRDLAYHHLTNAYRQLLDAEVFKRTGQGGGPFVHLALSKTGYDAIGRSADAPGDPEFQAGMKAPASIVALSDPPVTAWQPKFREDLHGVVLVAHETPARTGALALQVRELIEEAGGEVVFVQHGAAVRNTAGEGIEHFGYVDGRSQPLLLAEDIAEERESAGTDRWDPAFPLKAALVKDPGTVDAISFGSYFVFRKLEQHVRAFKTREQKIADKLKLKGDDRELAGAMIVGRFEDGTPVTMSKVARGEKPPNDFDYDSDPGIRCPFHGHIRKTNPRGSGGAPGGEEGERTHIMPRRGILYEDARREVHPDELPETDSTSEFLSEVAPKLPKDGVGLLFMAYNQSIAGQFKFTQETWANNAGFPLQPPGPHGIDPVIGQGVNGAGQQKLPKVWDDDSAGMEDDVGFAGFVTMKGGEYFFSPSLTFLLNL